MRTRDTASRLSVVLLGLLLLASPAFAEDDAEDTGAPRDTRDNVSAPSDARPADKRKLKKKGERDSRYYFAEKDPRRDAGVFHVAFAFGGNFYFEPKVNPTTKAPIGSYFRDFGFQGGAYFDYDYSQLEEDIPLMLRGFIGYKYILNTTHVFSFDGVVRRQFHFSEGSSFGLGAGGSVALWYRPLSAEVLVQEIILLPSLILTAGFEFHPFMVDFKYLINRIGSDSTIMGFELYFGFRI